MLDYNRYCKVKANSVDQLKELDYGFTVRAKHMIHMYGYKVNQTNLTITFTTDASDTEFNRAWSKVVGK